jgi:predicted nucleotidyltransferase
MTKEKTQPGYSWETCSERVKSMVLEILSVYQRTLGRNLVGFYLHGSLAMGCFNPILSDIDFLAVVKNSLITNEKKAIILCLLEAEGNSPAKGLEMSIVLEDYVKHFVYPTPFELHYSRSWHERFRSGLVDLTEQRVDTDLAAHFVVIRQRGLCLFGKPILELFGEIPREYYIQSLLTDAETIYGNPEADPLYTVLNLPRILAFLEVGRVLSKMEAVIWAKSRLPNEFETLLISAQQSYSGRTNPDPPDASILSQFTNYMKGQIANRLGAQP